jgi:peptidoglycan/LPS O-acetylase OafA/YrhL
MMESDELRKNYMNSTDGRPAVAGTDVRYFNLDFGRALAITLVTGFHLWRFYGGPASAVSPILASGYTGVDLFFVISGYAMTMTWQRQRSIGFARTMSFWLARLLRIYPAYLVAMLLWVIMARAGIAPKPTATYDVVMHTLMLHTLDPSTFFSVSGVFWTLAVEVHFYLLFPLLIMLSRQLRFAVVLLALLLDLALTLGFAGRFDPMVFPVKWNAITFLPLFLLGIELHGSGSSAAWRPFAWLAGLVAVTMMFAPELFEPMANPDRSLALFNRLLIGAGLGLLCIKGMPSRVPRNVVTGLIARIGVASYSIYLYNYIFFATKAPLVGGVVGYLLSVVAVMAFGIMMWWLIERPAEAIRHGWRSRHAAVPSSPKCVGRLRVTGKSPDRTK